MLTKDQLINVKLHKNLTLNLAPNINIFVGHTEDKTGMLKASLGTQRTGLPARNLSTIKVQKSCKVLIGC